MSAVEATATERDAAMLHDPSQRLDPLGDAEDTTVKSRAKVGSARPSTLLYTYGSGAILDLPNFSVMPAGLDDWNRIWKRRATIPTIDEPRLLDVVRLHLGPQVAQLRPYPWQPKLGWGGAEGTDLGVPARVFPQWLRCTGCNYLGPLSRFRYKNEHPYRPDLARFTHENCPGHKRGRSRKTQRFSPAVPAQHLLTCANGHLDEFPYTLWVHRGKRCSKAAQPDIKMKDANVGKGVGSIITCSACGARRGMAEAQGRAGRSKLPQACRGRHPHLNAFDASCDAQPALIMMGASNVWFSSTQSIIVMPRTSADEKALLIEALRTGFEAEELAEVEDNPAVIRILAKAKGIDVAALRDADLISAVSQVLAPAESDEERQRRREQWDPVELLVPEWDYLQKPSRFPQQENTSDLMVTERLWSTQLRREITRVVAVNKMKKVNAVLGFTRLDDMNRAGDLGSRLVKLTRDGRSKWVPATEDRGEGIFLQLDLDAVEHWEHEVLQSQLWNKHRQAHHRNFSRRFSDTAEEVDPDERLPAPRYWLLHTLAHLLIREMAMFCGYGAASLTERIYGWRETSERDAAAGLLICTTASDSEGTLGGLVALSEPKELQQLVDGALRRAARCSSDPVCAMRVPSDPEDFLHGAACHCCSFASETSCERANRFLDRRMVLNLPTSSGESDLGFFGDVDVW